MTRPEEDDDFAFEPIPGLPERLPAGEAMLWQGSPAWWTLALTAFHVRKVWAYVALLLTFRFATAEGEAATAAALLTETMRLGLVAALATAILSGLAFLYARGTIYTLTTKRVVIRSGLALPVTLNLPLALIGTAAVQHGPGQGGSIALDVLRPNRIAYAALWPNVRPWRINHPQPMLRALADVETPSRLLARSLFESLDAGASLASAKPARLGGATPIGAASAGDGLPAGHQMAV